jgi:hypothetical protein
MTQYSRKKAFRTIFIGLGGTGNEVIRRVKQEMLRHNYDLPIFQYLVLDTVAYHEDPGIGPLMHLRNGEEYLYIGGYNPNEILKQINNWPVIARWWGIRDSTNLVTVDEGAGQMRSVGRMGFFRHFSRINARLEQMVQSVMSNSNRELALHREYDVPDNKAPVIYLVFSLCGGTGSSLFFDVAYVLRKLFDVKPIIVGLAMLPGPYIQKIHSELQRERIQANTYAALQELERLHSMALGQEPRPNGKDIWDVQYATNFQVASPELPFDYIYLIDDKTTTGERFTRDQIYDLMGQTIFWLSGPSTAANFWERAKNLSSNTLAGGGRPDGSGRLRLPKYSSFGISQAMLDWNIEHLHRELELRILNKIRTTPAIKPTLSSWLSNADLLINKIGDEPGVNPIPTANAFKPNATFKDRAAVDDMLDQYTTKYEVTLAAQPRSPRWVRWRDTYQKQVLTEVNTILQHSLKERGPVAALQEMEAVKEALEAVQKRLGELEGIASLEAKRLEGEYNKTRHTSTTEPGLRLVFQSIGNGIRYAYGVRNKNMARTLHITAKELAHQRYLWYAESFRAYLCKDIARTIIEPAIAHAEMQHSTLTDVDDELHEWYFKLQQTQTSARANTSSSSNFETIIRVKPHQSEQNLVSEAIKQGTIRFDALVNKVLTKAYSSWPKQGGNAVDDLKEAMPDNITAALQRLGSQAHLLDMLLAPGAWQQREMFLKRAECLWKFSEDYSQEVTSHLETINILGYGIDNGTPNGYSIRKNLQARIDDLLKQQNITPEPVSTDILDELVYLKTSHGLAISHIHSLSEMHHAYQVLNTVRAAPYLHLDYRDQVKAGYGPLANIEMTPQQIIDTWTEVANSLDQTMKGLAHKLRAIIEDYEDKVKNVLDEIVSVKDENDPLFTFVNDIQEAILNENKTPVISDAMTRLADLTGLLHAQGWVVIYPVIGSRYNKKLHQSTKRSTDDGTIIEVKKRGYLRQRPNQPDQVLKALVEVDYDITKTDITKLPTKNMQGMP